MGKRLLAPYAARPVWALAFALCACSPNTSAKFYGLSEGSVSSFTSTSDGCIVSLLFDDFQAPTRVPSKAAPVPTRAFTLAASPAAAGTTINFDIRGALQNAAGAKIHIKAGGRQLQLEPKSENFLLSPQAPASANGETRVEVSLELPPSDGAKPTDQLLSIDSIDVSLTGCSSQGKRS